jgi:hypothetical protein
MRVLFAVVLLVASAITAASAQPIPMSPELAKFMSTSDEERTAKAYALNDWKLVVPNCANPRLQGANVVVHVAPKFDAAGKPVSGRWQVVSRVEGCGVSKVVNLQYGFGANGQLIRLATLPGTTMADPTLQRDALTYAATGMAKLAPSGCKDFKYLDTAFEAFGPASPTAQPNQPSRTWTEKWMVRACGVDGIVRMYFVPNATGTSVSVKPDETVRVSSR